MLDIETDPSIEVDHAKKRICPKCEGIVLMRHYYSVRKKIEVDECPGCAGFWIDRGELAAIRNLFDSEKDRQKAAEDYFNNTFRGQMEKMKAERQDKHQRADDFAKVFRFITPSSYFKKKNG